MECNIHHQSSSNDGYNFCITQVPIFCHLDHKEMLEVSKLIISKEYAKGEFIFLSGEPLEYLFIINKGKVKITKVTESGKEQILRILNPGDFMGELSLFGQSSITNNAEAIEHTDICLISRKDMGYLVQKFPNIGLKILAEFSNRLEMAENLIVQLGLYDVEQRVAGFILQLAANKEKKSDGSIDITLSVSKRDLASLIGTSQETLSRKLSLFQDNGWIKLQGQRNITILDEQALRKIAGTDPN